MARRRDEGYRNIVNQFEKFVQTSLGERVVIADFCSSTAINHQTLLRAFRTIRGITPTNQVRGMRLMLAKQALSSTEPAPESVTHVALQFGFREFGRFAAEYRAAFGENPSDTLRRTATNLRLDQTARHHCTRRS